MDSGGTAGVLLSLVQAAGPAAIWAAALAAVLSWALTGLARIYAVRAGLVDHPGERHSHQAPTPRGGGLGPVLALLAVAALPLPFQLPAWWWNCLAPALGGIALLGWWDDHRSLSVRLRLGVQAAIIAWLLFCFLSAGWAATLPALVLAGLFLAWMTNLYNFMDGSDGMAGLQGVFAGLVLAWLYARAGDPATASLALLLAAVCLGYLPWNLPRARIFMGDVGSLTLGFCFGALLLRGFVEGAIALPVGLLVMGLFLTDSTATLLVRVMRGERWYNAHRQHLYQRLIAQGWSHGRVAVFYQAVNLVLVLPGIGVAVRYPELAWPVALILASVFVIGWYRLRR